MDENIKYFIEDMKTHNVTKINEFANAFTEEAYNVFMKLKNEEPLTTQDFDLALIEHKFDKDMMMAIITAPHMPPAIKDYAVENFIQARASGRAVGYNTNILNAILESYTKIPDSTLKKLFINFHAPALACLCSTTAIEDGLVKIPQSTIDRLLKFEIQFINGEFPLPSGTAPRTGCFQHAKNNETLDYILNNMPENARMAEMVSTYLINSPYIDNETKNNLFEKYGCDAERLRFATQEIIETIYMSVVESMFPPKEYGAPNYEDAEFQHQAMVIIDSLLSQSVLPETMQIDLANRAIYDSISTRNRKVNEVIMSICTYTDNPNVLNFIVMESNNRHEVDAAIKNEHASDNTIRFYAHYYCEKMEDQYRKGKGNKIADRWQDMVAYSMLRTKLNDYDYDTAFKSRDIYTLETAIDSYHTPDNVLQKVKDIIDEQYKITKSNDWLFLKINLYLRQELINSGWKDQQYFNVAKEDFERLRIEYRMDSSLKTVSLSTVFYKDNLEFAKQLPEIIKKAMEKADYKPYNSTLDDMCESIKNIVQNKIKHFEIDEEKAKKDMSKNELYIHKERAVKELFDYVLNDNIKCYYELDRIAAQYTEAQKYLLEKTKEELNTER